MRFSLYSSIFQETLWFLLLTFKGHFHKSKVTSSKVGFKINDNYYLCFHKLLNNETTYIHIWVSKRNRTKCILHNSCLCIWRQQPSMQPSHVIICINNPDLHKTKIENMFWCKHFYLFIIYIILETSWINVLILMTFFGGEFYEFYLWKL